MKRRKKRETKTSNRRKTGWIRRSMKWTIPSRMTSWLRTQYYLVFSGFSQSETLPLQRTQRLAKSGDPLRGRLANQRARRAKEAERRQREIVGFATGTYEKNAGAGWQRPEEKAKNYGWEHKGGQPGIDAGAQTEMEGSLRRETMITADSELDHLDIRHCLTFD